MSAQREVLLLAADDAAVTLGAQFREVALGLLITQLHPTASSYAWYFLVGSLPGALFARFYARASLRWPPRSLMMATYGLRLLLVLVLWRVESFWAALVCLGGIAFGSGLYSTAQAHFVAVAGDLDGTQRTVMRLRQSEAVLRLIGPLAAGLALEALGFRRGFLISGAAYLAAMALVGQLSRRPAAGDAATTPLGMSWRPDGPAAAMFGLSFLTWQANTLAVSYTFYVLHRHAFGFGLTLSVWGGSGLGAAWLLRRLPGKPMRWVPWLFLLLGGTWLVLSRGVTFPVFVALGGLEGCASFLVQDLVVSKILAEAPSGKAGVARARLGVFDEWGSIAGMVTILLVPASWLVLPFYGLLGLLGIAGAMVWMGWLWRSS